MQEPTRRFAVGACPVATLIHTMRSVGVKSLSPAIYFYFIDTFFTRLFTSVDSNVLQDTLVAHTDAIWDLAINSTRCQLLSASSDGTVRLWEPGTSSGLLATYQVEDGLCIHCSVGSCVLTVISTVTVFYRERSARQCRLRSLRLEPHGCRLHFLQCLLV